MPIYEFLCPRCNTVDEQICKLGESGESLTCHRCGYGGLVKKISSFSSPVKFQNDSRKNNCAGGNCQGCK